VKHRLIYGALVLGIAWVVPISAFAGLYTDEVSKCLVSSTTSADRNGLVRWMFAIASLHPEVSAIAIVAPETRDAANKEAAALFQRLLLEACKEPAKNALQYEGPGALDAAFSVLGQIAGRELFTNPEVAAAGGAMAQYLDSAKLQEELGMPQIPTQ
jgi:hypothetical protein